MCVCMKQRQPPPTTHLTPSVQLSTSHHHHHTDTLSLSSRELREVSPSHPTTPGKTRLFTDLHAHSHSPFTRPTLPHSRVLLFPIHIIITLSTITSPLSLHISHPSISNHSCKTGKKDVGGVSSFSLLKGTKLINSMSSFPLRLILRRYPFFSPISSFCLLPCLDNQQPNAPKRALSAYMIFSNEQRVSCNTQQCIAEDFRSEFLTRFVSRNSKP